MKHQLKFLANICLASCLLVNITGCKKNKKEDPEVSAEGQFHIALAVGSGSRSKTYVQSLNDLSTGNISYTGYGFEVPSTRTARIYTSSDAKSLYNLDYGGGQVYKYSAEGGQNYTQVSQTNVQYAIGTANPRWTKVNDQHALLHHVTPTTKILSNDSLTKEVKVRLVSVELNNLTMGSVEEFTAPVDSAEYKTGNYISRIDAPVVVNGKAYYGVAKSKVSLSGQEETTITAEYTNATTLVVDYPTLRNPKLITTSNGGAKGATNGYRTPNAHVDERGDIYQATTTSAKNFKTHFLRISNGEYDDYSFDFSAAIGHNTITNGWFYVGNGIAYVPYANSEIGESGDPVWGLARVDLYNKSVVKLNMPENLWLQQYQHSVVKDGKFYIAIAPLGGEGHIYIFDINSTDPNAYTKGASLQTGADAYYIGIF
jgi:hypothetical protein